MGHAPLDILLNGSVDLVDHQCRVLLRSRYRRVTGHLGGKPVKLDDIRRVEFLKQRANTVADDASFKETVSWVEADPGESVVG